MPAPAVTPALLAYDNTVVFRTFVARLGFCGGCLREAPTALGLAQLGLGVGRQAPWQVAGFGL